MQEESCSSMGKRKAKRMASTLFIISLLIRNSSVCHQLSEYTGIHTQLGSLKWQEIVYVTGLLNLAQKGHYKGVTPGAEFPHDYLNNSTENVVRIIGPHIGQIGFSCHHSSTDASGH